ncbi:MAG: N-acetylmuramoyl-L-alanine amidase [Candidatus Omnitrophota bacterium]
MRYFRYISSVAMILLFAGCAGGPRYTPSQPAYISATAVAASQGNLYGTPQTLTHVVGPQETLFRISKVYGVDIQTLMQANGIQDPNVLNKGQKLIIPGTFGARPVVTLLPSRKWKYIVIHHTATDVGNMLSIDQMHHDRGFWNGLGYHFLIDNGSSGRASGQIEAGPRWIKQMDGAHCKAGGMNEMGIGIGVVGDFSKNYMSQSQMDSLVYLVKTLQDFYGIPTSRVIGHRDAPGAKTECPGDLFPWVEFKRRLS